MITQRMMVRGVKTVPDVWEITVNTEATTQGEKTTGIPFNLYEQDGVSLTVDWGDGTTSILTSDDYTFDDATASVHTYTQAGIYTISIQSKSWQNCYILQAHASGNSSYNLPTTNNAIAPLYWYQRTLIGVGVVPGLKGANYYISNNVPTDLYKSAGKLGRIFERCTKLTNIPNKLFSKNSHITDFYGTFEGCTSIEAIPGDIFHGVPGGDFGRCFEGCFSLQSIPSQLFDDCTSASSFLACFTYCRLITEIPANLFANCHNINDLQSTFMYCESLSSLPPGLLTNQSKVTNFNQCFAGTNISSIPSGFFDGCIKAQNFRRAFSDCPALSTIPAYLFKNCAEATSFIGTFGGYVGSGSTPDYNGVAGSFWGRDNIGITSIPGTLFSGAVSATNFEYTFAGCSSLASIPEGLFADNLLVERFRETFRGCTGLQSIPTNIFKHNTATITVENCFDMRSSQNQMGDFAIHVGSSSITNADDFITAKTGTTRTIYVPSGSTTETTFNAVAADLGLTIIGE